MGRPAHSKRGSKVQVTLYLTPEEIDHLASLAPGGTTPSRALHGLLKDSMQGTPVQSPRLQAQPETVQPVVGKKARGEQAVKQVFCPHCIRKQNWTDVNCPHCKALRGGKS